MLIAISKTAYPVGIDVPKGHYPSGYHVREEDRAIHARSNKPIVVPFGYEVMPATSMLQRTFTTDAHFVDYIVHDSNDQPLHHQPRVNKDGAEWVQRYIGKLWFQTLTFDYDLEKHRRWESDDEAKAFVERCETIVPTAIIYATGGGCRIMQPLSERVPLEKA